MKVNFIKDGRILFLAIMIVPIFVLFTLRLSWFQIIKGEEYLKQVQAGSVMDQTIAAARGEILDANGQAFTVNRKGNTIIFDRLFLPQDKENEIIFNCIKTLQKNAQIWIDNLPITTTEPLAFKPDSATAIQKLKSTLGVAEYATIEDVMFRLQERYKIADTYTALEIRHIAGVQYEMEKTGFNVTAPYTFAKNVEMQTVFEIKERGHEFIGVDVIETSNREYVDGVVAPHIIGRVGPIYKEEYEQLKDKGYKLNDTLGKDGIEKMMEDVLKGTDGERKIIMNKNREVVEVIDEKAPKPGNSVFLTIDKDIQYAAQIALQNKIEAMRKTDDKALGKDAQGGSIAVVDIKKGEILALANYPSFDLSTFAQDYDTLTQEEATPIFNRALDGQYMPGSIFKPVVALAGVAQGLITPTTTVNCQYVYTFYEDYQPTCGGGYHGPINVYDAMRVSCNTFFYDIGRQLGIEKINEYAKELGISMPTGIELPEKKGRLSTPEYRQKIGSSWFSGNILQVAIGQLDTEITPLQLANFMATLANKGKRQELSIIKKIKSYDLSETIYEHTPTIANTSNIPLEDYDIVIESMVQTARTGSARSSFADYPFDVAAKTGTPQNGYNWTNATFVAFAPADDPQIALSIVIEKGGGGHLISDVAKEIFDAYFFPNQTHTQTQLENNLIS